ncbi:hypothetical protein N9917_00910 [Deltaproteobacteria bacterium]|nr:hypothetical protein [Deltaproteobacteria bacterium]
MPQYGLCLRVTHTGKAGDSVHVSDIRDGVDLLASFRKAGPVYVPHPSKGGVAVLVYSGDVAVSFEGGGIRKFIEGGYLTAEFVVGATLDDVLGTPIEILDEAVSLTLAVKSIDFTGSGVTASTVGNDVTVNVPGGSSTHPGLAAPGLVWSASGHTGTLGSLPAFDGAGAATYVTGATQGDTLYFNGTVWSVLPPGTAGQFFETHGAGSNPSWSTITGTDIILANIPVSTYKTIQNMQDLLHSSGELTGGAITDAGGETIDVGAGTGLIRSTDDPTDTLEFFDWAGSAGIAVPTDSTRYVGIEYNAGTPQIVLKTSNTWDYRTDWPVGPVFNEGGVLHVHHTSWEVKDFPGLLLRRLLETETFIRSELDGGLLLGESGDGNRYVEVSPGVMWHLLHRIEVSSIDTDPGGGADSFDRWYRDSPSGFVKQVGVTTWDNTQYDDGTGTLATLTGNNFGVQWFYLDADGDLLSQYGRGEHSNLADAQAESPPGSGPDRAIQSSILIGKIIFRNGDTTATEVISAFEDDITGGGAGGDVSGPGTSTDHAIARWNGTTGTSIQNSGVIIDDSDNVTVPGGSAVSVDTITETTADNGVLVNTIRNFGKSAADPAGASPAPADGDTYYNTSMRMNMVYDGLRTKWLSAESTSFHFGRDGNTKAGQYYRAADGRVMSATSGWYAERSGTIISMAYTRTNIAAANFDLMASGSSLTTVASSALGGRDISINEDFTFGQVLAVMNQTGGGATTSNVIAHIRVKWRV